MAEHDDVPTNLRKMFRKLNSAQLNAKYAKRDDLIHAVVEIKDKIAKVMKENGWDELL